MGVAPSECLLLEADGRRAELPVGEAEAKAVGEQSTVFCKSEPLSLCAQESECVPLSESELFRKLFRLARLWIDDAELVRDEALLRRRFDEWVKHVPAEVGSGELLWCEFVAKWNAAVFGLNADVLGMALKLSEQLEVPAAAQFDDPLMKRIFLCFVALQWMRPTGVVHFSSHKAAKRLGIRRSARAWAVTRELERRGVLELVERGIPKVTSTEYRVPAEIMESVRQCVPDESEPASDVESVGTGPVLGASDDPGLFPDGQEVFV